MAKPYQYLLRPGYGSQELLLEFFLDSTDTQFENDLFTTLQSINPKVETAEDLWMNDEMLLQVSSDKGAFTLSRDNWDFVFIMAANNQLCIKLIDEILINSELFKKGEVDIDKYKNLRP